MTVKWIRKHIVDIHACKYCTTIFIRVFPLLVLTIEAVTTTARAAVTLGIVKKHR